MLLHKMTVDLAQMPHTKLINLGSTLGLTMFFQQATAFKYKLSKHHLATTFQAILMQCKFNILVKPQLL